MKFYTRKKKTNLKNDTFYKNISQMSKIDALKHFDARLQGLNEQEVEDRQKEHGLNVLGVQKFLWVKKILISIFNPFNMILMAIGVYSFVSYFLISKGDKTELAGAILVFTMIVLSVSITFLLDYRSHKSSERLREMVETTASVFRYDKDHPHTLNIKSITSVAQYFREIPIDEIVPGDLIFLSSGDMVPADVRIITSTDLFINQSTLTGEALPVEKHYVDHPSLKTKDVKRSLLDLQNLCFMGTSVVSGGAIALVTATGKNTYFGAIANSITGRKPPTSFNKGIKKVSYILIAFIMVMVPIIFLINYFTKNNLLEALLFSMSIAVGITPEMLPMIVSANLARGAIKLSKKKVIVKNLNAIQSFGAMNILCTDKTGTLTEDKIELVKYLDTNRKESEEVLKLAYLNSFFQTGMRNNIDKTLIEYAGLDKTQMSKIPYHKVDEIPFDFARRRMSVVVSQDLEYNTLICKGAVEEIINTCNNVEIDGQTMPITAEVKAKIMDLCKDMNSEGLRVIALGYKKFPSDKKVYRISDEKELTLLGYIGFLDVPKASAISAIASLRDHGVEIKILTGDNEIVTKAICQKVGINPGIPLLGFEMEELSDQDLYARAITTNIFAKMNPIQKARVIDVLKKNNNTVGFLGDGINDALGLRQADVGISVNSATDIAKEASDIILLEKDLDVLEQGVIGGRVTFGNILKYIKITLSSNFGNALSFLIGSIFIPFIVMLPIQILLQNLIYDISQLAIPWDRVDSEFLAKPQKWSAKSIIPFALVNGPISSLFDIVTFIFLGFGLGIFSKYHHATGSEAQHWANIFQSGWFILGIVTQTLIVHLLRTSKVPFVQSRPSWQLLTMTLVIIGIGILIPVTGAGEEINLFPVPGIFFAYLAGVVAAYFVLSQLIKWLYIKIFRVWL